MFERMRKMTRQGAKDACDSERQMGKNFQDIILDMINYFQYIWTSNADNVSLLTSDRIMNWSVNKNKAKLVLKGDGLTDEQFKEQFKWLDMLIQNISKVTRPSKNLIRGLGKVISKTEKVLSELGEWLVLIEYRDR